MKNCEAKINEYIITGPQRENVFGYIYNKSSRERVETIVCYLYGASKGDHQKGTTKSAHKRELICLTV